MRKSAWLAALVFFVFGEMFSQKLDHVQGQLLVQFGKASEVEQAVAQMQADGLPLFLEKEISAPFGVHLLSFDFSKNKEAEVLEKIRHRPEVLHAQFNHFVEMRSTVPDDPLFPQQWYWLNNGQTGGTPGAHLAADLAWDLTTGGGTLAGQDIVVCVLEGTNREHPDLLGNLWTNSAETPDDGIDNDGNGYVDDFEGWNVSTETDLINPEQHGTSVSGVIGAKGDNAMLLTGLNWHVKLMHVDFGSAVESNIVAAYTYPFVQRRRFNETNGAEGALVVATNASWGIDGADPADYPIWCAIYDSLGTVGILNCVATTNDNLDVDVVGDMPGNCASEHLICATATDANDERNFAGYGSLNVDVAAPGEDLTLLNLNGGPINDSGTSYAAPVVAGLVALLYSAPCGSIGKRAIADPPAMSDMVRQAIYEGVDLRPNLSEEVKTGGRVNAFKSLEILLEKCTRCEPPFGLGQMNVTDTSALLFWTSSDSTVATNLRWRKMGTALWEKTDSIGSPYFIDSLENCTVYEYQLEDVCADTTSIFTPSHFFETDGCCRAPQMIEITGLTTSGGTATWENILAAEHYNLHLAGPMQGLFFPEITATNFTFENLEPCTEYEVVVEVVCAGGASDFSQPAAFTTLGCGTCIEAAYCPSVAEGADDEWIANLSLNTLDHDSGADNGYGDFTHLSTDLMTWQNYGISITPGFTGFNFDEWFTVWIDYDQNGDFDGPEEEVFNSNGTAQSTVVGSLVVPGDALPGPTRMRVAMRFNSAPAACDAVFQFGEVEDYCANIIPGEMPTCLPPSGLGLTAVGPTFAEFEWDEDPEALGYELRIRPLTLPVWNVISTSATELTAVNLDFCALHQSQIRAVCVDEKSTWSPSANFMTSCFNPVSEKAAGVHSVLISPNPFGGELNVRFFNEKIREISFTLSSPTGRVAVSERRGFGVGEQYFYFLKNNMELPAGLYFLEIKTEEGAVVRKVVKS